MYRQLFFEPKPCQVDSILNFIYIFAHSIQKIHSVFMEKIIEERTSGQSLVLEQKEGNAKKLFIESYG
jgi:hypothetical protein